MCFFGVVYGKEVYQNMWQVSGIEYQIQIQRECGYWIFYQFVGIYNCCFFWVDCYCFGKQVIEVEVDVFYDYKGYKVGVVQQQNCFNNLYSGSCQYVVEQDIEYYQYVNQYYGDMVIKVEQQLDQFVGVYYLGNQIQGYYYQ